MITFNLSIDFELGWGDITRLVNDDNFYHRVMIGLELTPKVIDLLDRCNVRSTWGIVGACCGDSLEEVRERAPKAFEIIRNSLGRLVRQRLQYRDVLFCRAALSSLMASRLVEIGNHGYFHLTPNGLPVSVLQEDVSAGVQVLQEICGRKIESFIPPQNYFWPDAAFVHTGIRYVRHTPNVLGCSYSDPSRKAKIARLWNDFIAPASYVAEGERPTKLLFLRIDRGAALWKAQFRLLRAQLASGKGSIFCYTHPHNLDSRLVLRRFEDFCSVLAEHHAHGRLMYRKFIRELPFDVLPM